MIIFIYGTTAEAIKLAPIIRRLMKREIRFEQWLTFQHTDALSNILPMLGVPEPDRVIACGNRRNEPLKTYGDVVAWAWQIGIWFVGQSRKARKSVPPNSVVIVHGDTMTSVVGAVIGRLIKVPTAHVEAGLRSGNWRHPFPEELDRRIVGRLASIHYAPSEEARNNLASRANVIMTRGNTVIDSVLDNGAGLVQTTESYGLILLHRFEFISNSALVKQTLHAISKGSAIRLRLLVDAYSRATLESTLEELGASNIEVEAKLEHEDFVVLLRGAQFVITDSGGVQEESALLGVPTLIHRVATERNEGLGSSAVLSGWSIDEVEKFLADYRPLRQLEKIPAESPSDIIVNDLVERGLAG